MTACGVVMLLSSRPTQQRCHHVRAAAYNFKTATDNNPFGVVDGKQKWKGQHHPALSRDPADSNALLQSPDIGDSRKSLSRVCRYDLRCYLKMSFNQSNSI